MNKLVVIAGALALLLVAAGCGGPLGAGDGTPQGMWEQIGCFEENCVRVVAEKSPKTDVNGGPMWCVVMLRAGQVQGGLVRTIDGMWSRGIALQGTFQDAQCPRAEEELTRAQTSLAATEEAGRPPTPTPVTAAQVVGEPLPEGTLEFNQCRPPNCIALVTERLPKGDGWCVVLQQNGERQPWYFMQGGEGPPVALQPSSEAFSASGCAAAIAALAGP